MAFQINVIWPFLPFMVDTVRGTDHNAGLYVGLLASSYFWAQFAAAFVWGALPTKFGCKKCMVFSSIAVGVSLLGFGMSDSFGTACFWRLFGGLLNGNMPVGELDFEHFVAPPRLASLRSSSSHGNNCAQPWRTVHLSAITARVHWQLNPTWRR